VGWYLVLKDDQCILEPKNFTCPKILLKANAIMEKNTTLPDVLS